MKKKNDAGLSLPKAPETSLAILQCGGVPFISRYIGRRGAWAASVTM